MSALPSHAANSLSNALASFRSSVSNPSVSQWGLPNDYILGEEASGAFIGGLRYGEGTVNRHPNLTPD
jgi:hypothetical protein